LNLSNARLLISNAGQPYGFNSSAVFVTNGSTLNATASLVITGSRGQGVIVNNSSHAALAGSTITGGAHGGLVVVNESTAGATLTNPLTSISGNVADLFCDSKSQITGASYIANATVVQCNNILPGLYETLP
jgi:threonine aldolase